ncbi:hypothetical protein PIB30_027865 [Stylosanthes scabra]|uniref:Uncharacterized protein n=1 Tax=Stylosanthes scabra TaxID=79078 RepID=A0ABU6WBT7_9FABA|nr:hypothetical protein [Stylosanthes scabra]
MESGVIFYEYEKREKFEDYDMKFDAELGTFKIRRYHFDDESFVHPLHSVRSDPNHPYEIPIEALMADKIVSSSKDERSSTEGSRSSTRPMPHYSPREMPLSRQNARLPSSSLRKPRSWEPISPSEGWMCDGDDEKEIGGMKPSVKKNKSSEEDSEEEEGGSDKEEDPEEEVPASLSLPMDIDADEDYLCFLEELEYRLEPSPLCSSQASVPDSSREASDRQSDRHNASCYDLSGVWPTLSSGPSP